MKRLTEKRGGQNAIPLRQDGKTKWVISSVGMGNAPTQFLYGDHANKLADYEDAEEQGLLVRIGEKEPFPKEIEQILKNQIVIMGMLQNVKCLLEDTVIPDEIQNIQDTYEVLKSNKKLKEMEK